MFCRSKAFQFAFLQLEDDIGWFTRLLQQATGRDLNHINPTNCLGTVLAINGPRNYFSIYHAHEEQQRAKRLAKSRAQRSGDFIGLDDSNSEEMEEEEEESREEQVLFIADLLAGLNMWMEKLCEGVIARLRVESWPPMGEVD